MIDETPVLSRWLHSLAPQGGKGTVNNIDARALGRCGDAIDRLAAELRRAREALRAIIALDHHWHGPEGQATKLARAALEEPSDV